MDLPLDITTRDISLTERHGDLIRKKANGLTKFYSRITGCRVVIEGPGDRHRTGGPFKVKVDLDVPGSNVVVDKQTAPDVETAIRTAFDAAKRRLQDHARVRRGDVKGREPGPETLGGEGSAES